MSEIMLRSQGVTDSSAPALLSMRTYLAGFQYWELTSGVEATPASPMEVPRASGAMLSIWTLEGMGLYSAAIVVDSSSSLSAQDVEGSARERRRRRNLHFFIG